MRENHFSKDFRTTNYLHNMPTQEVANCDVLDPYILKNKMIQKERISIFCIHKFLKENCLPQGSI